MLLCRQTMWVGQSFERLPDGDGDTVKGYFGIRFYPKIEDPEQAPSTELEAPAP